MITGVHTIIFTRDADADRAFFRDVLELRGVDAGGGWLIFALPPAELAAHPTDGDPHHELYLMCDDIRVTVKTLRGKGVEFTKEISDDVCPVGAPCIRLATGILAGPVCPERPRAVGTAI